MKNAILKKISAVLVAITVMIFGSPVSYANLSTSPDSQFQDQTISPDAVATPSPSEEPRDPDAFNPLSRSSGETSTECVKAPCDVDPADMSQRIDSLKEQLAQVREEINEREAAIVNLNQEISSLAVQRSTEDKNLVEMRKKVALLSEEIKVLQKDFDVTAANNRIKQLEQQLPGLQSQKATYKKNIAQYEEDLDSFKKSLKDAQTDLKKAKTTAKKKQANKKIDNFKKKIDAEKKKIDARNVLLNDVLAQIKVRTDEITELKTKKATHANTQTLIAAKRNESEALTTRISASEQNKADIANKLTQTQELLRVAMKEKNELVSSRENIQDEIESLEGQFNTTPNDALKEAVIANIESLIRVYLNAYHDSLAGDLASSDSRFQVDQQILALEAEIKGLEEGKPARLQAAQAEVSGIEARIAELQEQLANYSSVDDGTGYDYGNMWIEQEIMNLQMNSMSPTGGFEMNEANIEMQLTDMRQQLVMLKEQQTHYANDPNIYMEYNVDGQTEQTTTGMLNDHRANAVHAIGNLLGNTRKIAEDMYKELSANETPDSGSGNQQQSGPKPISASDVLDSIDKQTNDAMPEPPEPDQSLIDQALDWIGGLFGGRGANPNNDTQTWKQLWDATVERRNQAMAKANAPGATTADRDAYVAAQQAMDKLENEIASRGVNRDDPVTDYEDGYDDYNEEQDELRKKEAEKAAEQERKKEDVKKKGLEDKAKAQEAARKKSEEAAAKLNGTPGFSPGNGEPGFSPGNGEPGLK